MGQSYYKSALFFKKAVIKYNVMIKHVDSIIKDGRIEIHMNPIKKKYR
jgi:hypothetical protein